MENDEIVITIKTVIDKRQTQKELTGALDSPEVESAAKRAGQKLGNALFLGIRTGRNQSLIERDELAHLRRLEAVHLQSGARLQQLEARRLAQIDLIRERSAQKAIEHERKLQRESQRSANAIDLVRGATNRLAGAFAVLGGAAAFRQIAQLGIDLDRLRNAMATLSGGIDQANKKMAELRDLAKVSPGVTTSFAIDLFNRLKAVGGIGDEVIARVTKSLGKLSTVFADVGPEFSRNLIQIFSTSFERDDIKQALNAVPIFEQLLERGFGTKDPAKLRKLKEAGALTLGGFLTGISGAIDSDPRMKLIGESLGGKVAKQFDETKIKLAELGEKILKDLLPILDKLLPVANKILNVFTAMPTELQATIVGFGLLAGPIASVTTAIRNLAAGVVTLNAAGTGSGLLTLARLGLIGAGVVGVGAVVGGVIADEKAKRDLQQTRIDAGLKLGTSADPRAIQAELARRFGNQDKLARIGLNLKDVTTSIFKPTAGVTNAGGGGGTGATRAPRVDPIAQEIARMSQLIIEGRNDFFEGILNDMESLNKQLLELNAEQGQRETTLAGRPAQLAGFAAATAERIRAIEDEDIRLTRNTREKAIEEQREALEKLVPVLSNSERLMKGFESATISVGDAFDRFGANVAGAFTNVRTLFDSLKRAVLGFFNDILGSALQNLVKSTLGGLFGGGSGGGGIGNFFRSLTGGGGGISAPASVSGATGIFANGAFARGLSGGGGGGFLSGIGGSLAAAAPLLGLGLGGSFGGQSGLGQVLGSIGGGAVGLGLSFGASVFGAGGGLGAASLAALGPAALIGAPLIVGAILLGKASQRRKDEAASGDMLTQALTAIQQLKAGIASDQIEGSQARSIFDSQILAQFQRDIGGLKTKSVRESRLTNQVRDLRRNYDDVILPEIAAQLQRRQNALIDRKIIPEFAVGGMSRGGLALLHPNEMVLTVKHQQAIAAHAGADIFNRVGVPGPQPRAVFDNGGVMPSVSAPQTIVIENLTIGYGMSASGAEEIFVAGGSGDKGQTVIVKQVNRASRDKGKGRMV